MRRGSFRRDSKEGRDKLSPRGQSALPHQRLFSHIDATLSPCPLDDLNMTAGDIATAVTKAYDGEPLFTYAGDTLLAVGPRFTQAVYDASTAGQYSEARGLKLAPHLFSTVLRCHQSLVSDGAPQTIAISGSETTNRSEMAKAAVRFLSGLSDGALSIKTGAAMLILEAFSNPAAPFGGSSSRMYSVYSVFCRENGEVKGLRLEPKMFDTSFVVSDAEDPSIFTLLTHGCPATERSMYHLKEPGHFRYLSPTKRNGSHSSISFDFVKKSFLEMNIQVDEQEHIMAVVSAVLHLGNVEFDEACRISNDETLETAALLLGVQPKALERILGEHGSKQAAEQQRDDVARAIYGVLVCIITARLNDELGREYSLGDLFIAVLDTPGFLGEALPLNQSGLLSNMVNELELEYLLNLLVDKEKTFLTEGVPWASLDLKPRSIGTSLKSVVCGSTQEEVNSAAAAAAANHPKAITWNADERFLRVSHGCSTVVYDLSNPLATTVSQEISSGVAELLQGSKKAFLNSHASKVSEVAQNVLARHTNQVSALLQPLKFTRSHYIHTISAVHVDEDPAPKADKFHVKCQLEWCFAEERLRFADCFMHSLTCSQFLKFYGPLASCKALQEETTGPHALMPHCKTVLLSLGHIDPSKYHFTDDSIWMKSSLHCALEDLRIAMHCTVEKSKTEKRKSKKRRSGSKASFAELDLPKKRNAFPINLSPRTWTHGAAEQKLGGDSVPKIPLVAVKEENAAKEKSARTPRTPKTPAGVDEDPEKDKSRLAAFMHDISSRSLTHSEGLQALLSLSPRGKVKKSREDREGPKIKRVRSRSSKLSPRSAFAEESNIASHSSPTLESSIRGKLERPTSKLAKAARSNSTGAGSRFSFSRGSKDKDKDKDKSSSTRSTPTVALAEALNAESSEEDLSASVFAASASSPLAQSLDDKRPGSARKSAKRISLKSLVKSRSTSQKRLVTPTTAIRRHTDDDTEEKRIDAARASLGRLKAFSSEADKLDQQAAAGEVVTTDDDSDDSLLLSDDSCMDVSEMSDGEDVCSRPGDVGARYGRDKLIKRRASQAIVSKDFIEKVENFAWKQSRTSLEGVPAVVPESAQKRQELQTKRRDEFLILYECGSLLRTVYRKDVEEAKINLSQTVKRGRSRSFLAVLNNSMSDEEPMATELSSDEGKPSFSLEAKVKRDLELFRLNPTDPVEVAVSCLNYNNPIQLTPRRKNAASTNMFTIPGTQKYEDYALAYFALPKKMLRMKPGSSKYNAKLKKFLSARKKPLAEPLHNFRSEGLVSAALEAFRHILAYSELRDETSDHLPPDAYAHAAALLQLGLERASLRDELYCQLIKQTRGSKEAVNVRVWELLSFCSGNFAPSSSFINYYKSFLTEVMEDSGPVGAVASNCKDRLEKVVNYGKRLLVPTMQELRLVQQRKPMMQTFFFMDGRQKQVPIYSSTTSEEALDFLLVMVGLRDPKGYMIYEHYRVTRPNGKVEMTEKSLLYSEVLCNSLSKFEIFENAFRRYQKSDRAGEEGIQMECYFLVKRKLFLNPRTLSSDKVENMLLFHQTHRSIVADELLLKESDALILGGLLLQIVHGDHVKGLSYSPSSVLPGKLRKQKTKKEWKKLLNTRHRALRGVAEEEAKEMFLQYSKQLPFFGFNLFSVSHSSTWRMPPNALLGINLAGLFFLSEEKHVYYSFSFLEVLTYSSSPRSCNLSFDNGTSIVLQTDKGDEILSLIIDYKYFELKKELDDAT